MLVLSGATNFQRLHWRAHSKLTPTCVGRILNNKIGVRQRPAALPELMPAFTKSKTSATLSWFRATPWASHLMARLLSASRRYLHRASMISFAKPGVISSNRVKNLDPTTKRFISVSAITVAARGLPSIKAISPKKSFAERRLMTSPSFSTLASPSRMRMNSNPAAPSQAKTLPAITVWANANTILLAVKHLYSTVLLQ